MALSLDPGSRAARYKWWTSHPPAPGASSAVSGVRCPVSRVSLPRLTQPVDNFCSFPVNPLDMTHE